MYFNACHRSTYCLSFFTFSFVDFTSCSIFYNLCCLAKDDYVCFHQLFNYLCNTLHNNYAFDFS